MVYPIPAFKDRMPKPPAAKLVNSPGAVPAAHAAPAKAQSQIVAKANFAKAPKPAAAAALPKAQPAPQGDCLRATC